MKYEWVIKRVNIRQNAMLQQLLNAGYDFLFVQIAGVRLLQNIQLPYEQFA